jgi:hypothetical protein
MLSGISSYLFGSASAEDNAQPLVVGPEAEEVQEDPAAKLLTREEDEEWVLVDKAASECL